MSEVVERMARRMFPEMMVNASPDERESAFDLARAAAGELRDYVTHDMTEAGRYALWDRIGDELGETLEPDICAGVFRAMVDEALR